MSSEQLLNVKFVEAVEACPCLWDNKSKKYRNKEFVRDAWDMISDQFKEPVESCRERWRNIRNAFLRSMKRHQYDSACKKQYYLKSHLQFLMPFVRSKPNTSNFSDTEDNRASESEEETKPGPFLEESHANDSIEDSFRIEIEPESISVRSPENFVPTEPNNICTKRYRRSEPEIARLPTKRHKWNENDEEDPNLPFFKSLLRDVRKMDDRQNRKFRLRVMQIVDEILDEGLDANGKKQLNDVSKN